MAKPSSNRPILSVDAGEHAGLRVTIDADTFIIGRGDECNLILNDRAISRQHCRITAREAGYWVEDLNSKNGTWVNDDPVEAPRQLTDGAKIQLAMTVRLTYTESDATVELSFDPASIRKRLTLDPDARRVFIGGQEVIPPLSLPQYRLLQLLYDGAGAVCTREQVVDAVWPEAAGEGVSEQAIDALVRRLRDRLAEVDPEYQYVVTVRGHGFRLDNP
ncbi:MAG: FHA domain-containing protein [Anaerolineae bacterium]|nr:FHA domain-containing protein [Anaerolineae bacterium]